MKKYIFLTLMLSLFFSAFAQESVALTLKVKGDVNLNRADTDAKLEIGDSLINEDVLISRDDSFAAVRFVDGNAFIKLFSNSRLIISADKKEGKYDKKSYLKMGTLWSKVTKNSGSFDLVTPTTVVSVKGTEFITEVDKNGVTKVYAISGRVGVKNLKTGQEVILGAGEYTEDNDENPMEPGNINWDDVPEETGDEVGQPQVIELELENSDGENRSVEINFE